MKYKIGDILKHKKNKDVIRIIEIIEKESETRYIIEILSDTINSWYNWNTAYESYKVHISMLENNYIIAPEYNTPLGKVIYKYIGENDVKKT